MWWKTISMPSRSIVYRMIGSESYLTNTGIATWLIWSVILGGWIASRDKTRNIAIMTYKIKSDLAPPYISAHSYNEILSSVCDVNVKGNIYLTLYHNPWIPESVIFPVHNHGYIYIPYKCLHHAIENILTMNIDENCHIWKGLISVQDSHSKLVW